MEEMTEASRAANYTSHPAAVAALRKTTGNYARYQVSGKCSFTLLEFTGLTLEEFTEFAERGLVARRWLRVGFGGFGLTLKADHSAEMTHAGRGDLVTRAVAGPDGGWISAHGPETWAMTWQECVIRSASRSLPGAADIICAYIEVTYPADRATWWPRSSR